MTEIAVMQPTYLPWLGYFDLMDQVDEFVLLDSVQFSYQSWQHRNRIVGLDGDLQWLTVPVKRTGRIHKRIDEIELGERAFAEDHIRRLRASYDRAPFGEMLGSIYEVLARSAASSSRLSDVTIPLLAEIARMLGIDTSVSRSSELPVSGSRSHLLRSICEDRAAATYVSPPGALEYLQADRQVFDGAGIAVLIHSYDHPEYSQHQHAGFTPFASIVDLIANTGPSAADVLRSGRQPHQGLPPMGGA